MRTASTSDETTARKPLAALGLAVVLAACTQAPAAKTAGEAAAETEAAAEAAETSQTEPAEAAPTDAAAETAETGPEAGAGEAEEAPAPVLGAGRVPEFTEPERDWITDEEGRRFYVDQLKKYSGWYEVLDEDTVLYRGAEIDFIDQDDEFFYVRMYETDPLPPSDSGEPTPEQVEALEASYRFDTPTADRLRFQPFGRGLPRRGQWRNGFDVADLNGDGHLDILHPPPRRIMGHPVILLGDSQGNWRPWAEATFPRTYDYGDAAAADFNGDGHMDIALGIHLQGVRVLVGDGQGGFTEWSEGTDFSVAGPGGGKPSQFSSREIAVVDWNADGRPDVLALGEGPQVANPFEKGLSPERLRQRQGLIFVIPGPVIYLNQGDGTWVKHSQDETDHEIFGDSLALGDFDADGRVDFAAASNLLTRKDLVHYNRSGGDGDGSGGDGWLATSIHEVRSLGYVRAVTAADLDGDGRDDLAVTYMSFEHATWRSGLDLLYSRADGGWERRPLYSRQNKVGFFALDHGDVDGDGALDLAALDGDGAVWVWLGDGQGFFALEESPEMGPPSERCRGFHLRLVDLDRDGRDELLASFADEADAMFDPMRCPSQGGLSAWEVAP